MGSIIPTLTPPSFRFGDYVVSYSVIVEFSDTDPLIVVTDGARLDAVYDPYKITDFMGQDVALEFTFGSDSSVTYPGWYLASVKVGSIVVGVEESSMGNVKALFR